MRTKSCGRARRVADVESWARAAKPKQGGLGCRGCGAPKDAQEAMRTIAKMRRKRESRATAAAVTRYVNENFGTALSIDTVRRHFQVCLGTPWGFLEGIE